MCDWTVNSGNYFVVCCATRSSKQRSVSPMSASKQLEVNWQTTCETTRQTEWFWQTNLLVVCNIRNCDTGYVSTTTDLMFLLIYFNKWSLLKCESIKTCFFSSTIGFLHSFLGLRCCSVEYSGQPLIHNVRFTNSSFFYTWLLAQIFRTLLRRVRTNPRLCATGVIPENCR